METKNLDIYACMSVWEQTFRIAADGVGE